jgi:hypothetical protein
MSLSRIAVACWICAVAAHASAATKCSVESAASQVALDEDMISARIAKVMNPKLEELLKLTSTAKDPVKPLADQLSTREAGRFAEISQEIKGLRLSSFVESARSRDAGVIAQMFSTAWTRYVDPTAPAPKEDNFPGLIVLMMRFGLPNIDAQLAPVKPGECTIESALTLAENESIQRQIDDPVAARDVIVLTSLKTKYGADVAKWDKKMSPKDIRTLRRIMTEMQPSIRDRSLSQDLQNILDWWRVAELVYTTDKEDLSTYGSDMVALGNTLKAKQGLDQRTKIMIGLWGKINEKVPSRQQIEFRALADEAKDAGVK